MAARSMSREEAREVLDLVQCHGGNVSHAARAAGISRGTLKSKYVRAKTILGDASSDDPVDRGLADFATPQQARLLDSILAFGTIEAGAAAVDMTPDAARREITQLRINAARKGYAPGHFDNGVAPGNRMGKVTVQRNALGEVERTWERQSPDDERLSEIEAAIDRRIEAIVPRAPVPMPVTLGATNMLNQVTIADGHVGALAWDRETGSGDWDLGIARNMLVTGVCWLMDNLPPAEELLLMILGDFLDTDGYAPLTPASKHLLDVDGRYPKIADVGIEVIEEAVMHALGRYARVRLVIKPGNHDPLSSWWMRKLFARIFADNPRVTVEGSIRPYWGMLFGKTMVCSHHGDKASLGELPAIFASDFAQMWGGATYRVCHTGHMHHKRSIWHSGKEERGMLVLQHPTIAARNAWAADKGLAAARELLGHTYHSNGAMATTLHFSPEMLAPAPA